MPLRNALAELAIAGLEDDVSREALEWLAAPGKTPSPAVRERLAATHLVDPGSERILDVHAAHVTAVARHASLALRAAEAYRAGIAPATTDLTTSATIRAAALWNVGLFFEVHEILEDVWHSASGDLRHALQGLIQVAVAFHHLAHGNRRGARKLLVEGRRRLGETTADGLSAVDVGGLLEATAAWEQQLAGDGPLPDATPALGLRR